MIVGSPGVTLVTLGLVALFMGAAPVMSSGEVDSVSPTGTQSVSVDGGQSLHDIARTHVPEVPVGDAVADIAALNSGAGGIDDVRGVPSGELTVPVY